MRARTLAVAALTLSLGGAFAQRRGQEAFPEHVEVAERTLTLNGQAVQRWLVFKVYAIALYLEAPTADASQALESEQVKQLRLRLLRNASKEQIRSSLRRGLRQSGAETPEVEAQAEQVLEAIPDLDKGDTLLVTYVPGQGTTLAIEGRDPITIEGQEFAEAFFGIWLGEHTSARRTKRGLLGRSSRPERDEPQVDLGVWRAQAP